MLEGKELHDALKEFEKKLIEEQEEEDLKMLQEEDNIMARYLECSECKLRYEDEGSIKLALSSKENYIRSCKEEGYEAKGICPCPNIGCVGELILIGG